MNNLLSKLPHFRHWQSYHNSSANYVIRETCSLSIETPDSYPSDKNAYSMTRKGKALKHAKTMIIRRTLIYIYMYICIYIYIYNMYIYIYMCVCTYTGRISFALAVFSYLYLSSLDIHMDLYVNEVLCLCSCIDGYKQIPQLIM